MDWLFNRQPVKEIPKKIMGFVYLITYTDGTKYIGKKTVRSYRKKHFGKKKRQEVTDRRRKTYEYVMTEHRWRQYEGSSKLTEGKDIHEKHILHFATNKTSLTYLEVRELFDRKVLEREEYINDNINGKWFDNCMEGYYYDPLPEQCLFGGNYD